MAGCLTVEKLLLIICNVAACLENMEMLVNKFPRGKLYIAIVMVSAVPLFISIVRARLLTVKCDVGNRYLGSSAVKSRKWWGHIRVFDSACGHPVSDDPGY